MTSTAYPEVLHTILDQIGKFRIDEIPLDELRNSLWQASGVIRDHEEKIISDELRLADSALEHIRWTVSEKNAVKEFQRILINLEKLIIHIQCNNEKRFLSYLIRQLHKTLEKYVLRDYDFDKFFCIFNEIHDFMLKFNDFRHEESILIEKFKEYRTSEKKLDKDLFIIDIAKIYETITSRPDDFENEVLHFILAGDHEILVRLKKQINKLKVIKRESIKEQYCCFFELSECTDQCNGNFEISDVNGILEWRKIETDFILFIEDGKISSLYGDSYNQVWPEDIIDFRLKYKNEPRKLIFFDECFPFYQNLKL